MSVRSEVRRTHERSMCMCARSAAPRSIHVAAANGMTTSLLPVAICLLCANLSQHIRVWPCPHLTLKGGVRRLREGHKERKGKEEEEIRAVTKTAAHGEKQHEREKGRSTGVYQRAKTRYPHSHTHTHTGIMEALPAQVITTHLPPPPPPGFKSHPSLSLSFHSMIETPKMYCTKKRDSCRLSVAQI